jgi:hypothetical protein
MIVIDSIDFTWAQSSPNRSEPEDLIHDFITLTGIKVGHVRADGAGEFVQARRAHHEVVLVPFASARTSYARFCGVQICLAVFGLMRYFIGVAPMPTGPMSAVIPRGKSSTNWGLTPSVTI